MDEISLQDGASLDIDNLLGDTGSSQHSPLLILKQAWINERSAPELLPFQETGMLALLNAIQRQLEVVESNSIRATDSDSTFELNLVTMEIERSKFIIRSYLRTRLYKLEKHAAFIVRNQDEMEKLSDDESRYVIGYQTLVENHYMDASLHSLPRSMHKLDEPSMLTQPDLDSAVFCLVNKDIGDVHINESDPIEMMKGQTYLLRYRFIRDLLQVGKLDLI